MNSKFINKHYVRLSPNLVGNKGCITGKVYRVATREDLWSNESYINECGVSKPIFKGFWRKATAEETYDSYMKYGATDVVHSDTKMSYYNTHMFNEMMKDNRNKMKGGYGDNRKSLCIFLANELQKIGDEEFIAEYKF